MNCALSRTLRLEAAQNMGSIPLLQLPEMLLQESKQSFPAPFINLLVVHILSPPNNKLSDSHLGSIAKLAYY